MSIRIAPCAERPQIVEKHITVRVDDRYIGHIGVGVKAVGLRVQHHHVGTVEKMRPWGLSRDAAFLDGCVSFRFFALAADADKKKFVIFCGA